MNMDDSIIMHCLFCRLANNLTPLTPTAPPPILEAVIRLAKNHLYHNNKNKSTCYNSMVSYK